MKKPPNKTFSLPQKLSDSLSEEYTRSGIKLSQISDAIESLSRYFQGEGDLQTPWGRKTEQMAYLTYFTPLNYLRNKAVIDRCQEVNFFDNIKLILDFGSGSGVSHFLMSEFFNLPYYCVESSNEAKDIHKKLCKELDIDLPQFISSEEKIKALAKQKGSLVLLSYSLNELPGLPEWIFDFEKILIIEPSTHQAARKLMNYRRSFIEKEFSVMAPCTHQLACPLLENSKKDWCHDRIHVDLPAWMKRIEDRLPMTNKTLTFSYLALSKGLDKNKNPQSYVRVIGDTKNEKGKIRQAICRGPEREFLAWLKKDKIKNTWVPRGQRVQFSQENTLKKGEEVRAKSEDAVQWEFPES